MSLKISVIGTGQLGATHAAGLAELGHEVLGVDVDAAKVSRLRAGRAPFHEPGLDELLARHVGSGRLSFTTSVAEAAGTCDVHFLCVGTPQRHGSHAANLDAIFDAATALARASTHDCLVVGKSTVPVGTSKQLAELLRSMAPEGIAMELAWNPEFLREGRAVEDTLHPDRLVFGVGSRTAEALLRSVYAPILEDGVPLVLTSLPTSELIKTAANAFLATKISFINAMAELCEAAGADILPLAEALGRDSRIGRGSLDAGLGFGGGCLPKDIRALMATAGELGCSPALTFLREVDSINMRCRHRLVELARQECDGDVLGKRITVLGAAFKPGSDDVRDSPALNVAAQLQLQGAQVTVHDPVAVPRAREVFPTLPYTEDLRAAMTDAELLLLLTDWPQFRDLDPDEVGELVAKRRIVDGRNALDMDRWRRAGWAIRAPGRAEP